MDKNGKEFNSVKNSTKNKLQGGILRSKKPDSNGEREEDNETVALLPARRGGLSQNLAKPKRKVQWNDKNGNKLAEVKEFQPSDGNDSDDEDSDSCMCTLM